MTTEGNMVPVCLTQSDPGGGHNLNLLALRSQDNAIKFGASQGTK